MSNYFSKYSLEEAENKTFLINKSLYRDNLTILTSLMYLIIFFVVSLEVENEILGIVIKVIIAVLGFAFHSFLQFHFSKKLDKSPGVKIKGKELKVIQKRYEPKLTYLVLFLASYFLGESLGFKPYLLSIVILFLAFAHLYILYRQDR